MTNPSRLPSEDELKEQEFEVTHIVTGPLVVVPRESGPQLYLYEGAPIPPDITENEVDRLIDTGLVRPVKDSTLEPISDEEMDALLKERAQQQARNAHREREARRALEEGQFDEGIEARPTDTPSRGASKGSWVSHAVDHGMDRAVAESMTRDELADHYLSAR